MFIMLKKIIKYLTQIFEGRIEVITAYILQIKTYANHAVHSSQAPVMETETNSGAMVFSNVHISFNAKQGNLGPKLFFEKMTKLLN